jgi:glycosyltransferase involved in cell wall biosynthesis
VRLSVVTVCFNSAATIGETLSSVAAQQGVDVEHIVVDGASTDGTLEVIRNHPWRPEKVISERDSGIYDAMNKGIALATGEVVGFLNADDLYDNPGVLAQVAAAFADPTVDATYADLVYVRTEDTTHVVRYWRSGEYRPGAFARGWVPAHPTFYVRRMLLARYGEFKCEHRLAADFEMMFRLIARHHICLRYIPAVQVRMRLGGATNESLRNVIQQNREILRAFGENGARPPNPILFIGRKILAKLGQRLRKP